MKISFYVICTAAFFAVGATGYFFGHESAPAVVNDISCNADLNISVDDIYLTGVMKFRASNGHGIMLINGSFPRTAGGHGVINRKVFFGYSHYGITLNLTSNKVDVLPSDTANERELAILLPKFFYTPDISHNFGVYRQGQGYIFAGTAVPFVFCLKS
ncbi:hypothetical protein RI049_18345 [Cedecea neteri]|uniref:hypothetical protein n=1 Tax=Cedecea neteri TaxID=158822 RepID=UPI002AA5E34F|nr:hypothetical protein [Cedecea neteri]WPU21990.1 hypothetical protein RI049_18345 [Cedecea neteri]